MRKILILALLLTALSACPTKPTEEPPKLYPGKIVIGGVDWPGYLALYVARDKGFFKEEGVDVEFRIYNSHVGYIADYLAGKIQGVTNLGNELIDQVLRGFDQRVVLVIDYSNGSDGIAASPAIKNFGQIRGKRVAYEHGTLEEYFFLYALEQYRLSVKEIVPVNLDPIESAKALEEGKVDAAVTYEPHLSKTIKKIGGTCIYSSADAPGLITDLLTFGAPFIENYPDSVSAIVRAYFRAIRFWKENPDEVHGILTGQFKATKEEVIQQLKGVTILDEQENQTALTFSMGTASLYGNLRRVGDFVMQKQGKKRGDLDTDKLIDKRFIKNLK
ncbi:MAG: ABC transporter substrate-binding protein [Deltaproteobacteria bacterium]|nr:ABC transporter substrate-binding protein [Deltaproteobacteria bacterium]